MAHRPKNPFCGVCIAGKAIASKALVRAVSLSDQLGVSAPFVALQLDHAFPSGRSFPILVIRDIVSSWVFKPLFSLRGMSLAKGASLYKRALL
eukprot:1677808-Amphidinium_carterae.1